MKTSELLHFDNIPLPEKALCPPEHIDAVLAEVRSAFEQLTKNLAVTDGVSLVLFDSQMEQQQQ